MNKALSLLGLAAKAGKISFGMEAVKDALKAKKACLALAASDVSEKSQKEITFFAHKNSIRFTIVKEWDKKAVSHAVGRECGVLTINDSGFAEAFLKAYVEGGNANDK